MNVIITGANGFIGSHLVNKFIDNGDNVFAIVRDKKEKISNISRCKNIIFCDLEKLSTQIDFFNDLSSPIVYHLAWGGVNGRDKADYETQIHNILLSCKVAQFSKEIHAKHLYVAGTIAEEAVKSFPYLKNISAGQMYSVSKLSTRLFLEAYCKNIGLEFTWMKFSNIFGPENKTGNLISYTIEKLYENKEAIFGPANQPYDFIYVDDLIQAIFLLSQKTLSKNCYFIGSGTPRILKEYLTIVGKELNKEKLIKIGERPDDGIKYSFEMFDISDIEKDIGKFNKTSFEDGIRKTIDTYIRRK